MNLNCIGRVVVPVPGTAVPLATDPTVIASRLSVAPLPGVTGATYLGTPSMDKSALSGVARVIGPTDSGFYLESQDGADSIRLMDYAIDADVAGEGMLVTYWTE